MTEHIFPHSFAQNSRKTKKYMYDGTWCSYILLFVCVLYYFLPSYVRFRLLRRFPTCRAVNNSTKLADGAHSISKKYVLCTKSSYKVKRIHQTHCYMFYGDCLSNIAETRKYGDNKILKRNDIVDNPVGKGYGGKRGTQ